MDDKLFNTYAVELWNHVASTTYGGHNGNRKSFEQFDVMLRQMLLVDKNVDKRESGV